VPVDAATFRAVLGQWPSGVTVITTLVDGVWHGMTASSFSSVSAEPPLVSVCLDKKLYTHDLLVRSGIYGVNILAKDQTEIGKIFAGMHPEVEDRFAGLDVETATTGVPLLAESLAWLDCRITNYYDAGDHTIFVGEVMDARVARASTPLLYHSRTWGQFADQLPDLATLSDSGLLAATAGKLPTEQVAQLLRDVHGSGVHVRVADLTRDLTIDDAPTGEGTRALIASSADVKTAAKLGVSAVDVEITSPADVEDLVDIAKTATEAELAVRAIVIDAFAASAHQQVVETARALSEAGITDVLLEDTHADASPLNVRQRLQDVIAHTKPNVPGVRLREHAGLGMANALTVLKSGVHHIDGTLAGADGTLATEDILYLYATLNIATDIDRPALVRASDTLESAGLNRTSHTHRLDIEPARGGNS
jgi:flavin reductase (DIM6/NTAB) family NADH-FMN oxidoreductase RutF